MYTIDAQGKKIGRIATEAAVLLMDKHTAGFERNKSGVTSVRITNASKADISEKKLAIHHVNYSGYPGGLKKSTVSAIIGKKGTGEIIRRAVKGMLPSNKLRADRLKRLTISE